MPEHHHQHNHQLNNHSRAFIVGIVLNISFVVIEFVYGYLANSSALVADAGHNLSDVLSLIFAWFAIWLSSKKPAGKFTYGYKKTTILASVLNAFLLFIAVGFIGWDAIGKFANPQPVSGTQVMIVAGIGVFINTITALMFLRGQKDDINIKGAFLHMAADAAVSLGVVVSGFLILKTGLQWIDPLMSFIIIALIIWGTWKLFIEGIRLALDAVPNKIDIEKVKNSIMDTAGVSSLHDLHVWAMSTTEIALSAHLVVLGTDNSLILEEIRKRMNKDFNIKHLTIQIENREDKEGCQSC
jgi:cobalt-zinc-cadmium efflux system protein